MLLFRHETLLLSVLLFTVRIIHETLLLSVLLFTVRIIHETP